MGARRYYEYVAVGEVIYVTLLNQHVEEENKRLEARSKKKKWSEEIKKDYHPADSNGDGVVSDREHEMYLEFKRKELDDQDAQRDAMRKMTWYALAGLLLYPFLILVTSIFGAENASKNIADIAPTYFVAAAELSCSVLWC